MFVERPSALGTRPKPWAWRGRRGENVGMYALEAVIASQPVLRELAGSIREAHFVDLDQRLSLLVMTDELFDAVTVVGAHVLDGFRKVPAGFDSKLAACSVGGPVAYVEADFFGGVGTQSAQVWDRGAVVLGPVCTAVGEPDPALGSPISQALRKLGVVRGDHFDEFDAVGLGRHRRTEDWLPR